MNIRAIGIAAMVSLFCATGIVYGAEVAKIGVVDLQRIIDTSNAGKRSSAEIKKQGKKMEKILKEKEAGVEEMKKALEQKALVMSQESREDKERALRIKMNDFKSLRKRYLDKLKEMNLDFSSRIKKKVFEIVDNVGRSGGYQLILERHVGGVVYAPNAIDITDKVIEKYNEVDANRAKEKKTE